jgi:hypothetical protein
LKHIASHGQIAKHQERDVAKYTQRSQQFINEKRFFPRVRARLILRRNGSEHCVVLCMAWWWQAIAEEV